LLAVGLVLPGGPVGAETPTEVADETLTDGVYIGFGRSRDDEAALKTAVERASFDGINLVVVKPADPQPTARAFARRVQEQTEADAALVFPVEGAMEAYVADDFGDSALRAVNAGRDATDPVSAVEAFTEALTTEPEVETPPIVRQVALVLVAATLTIAAIAAIEARFFRNRRPSQPQPLGGRAT
jgi:hypothetical protein